MHIEEMTAKEIAEVLLAREDGLDSISNSVLVDEIVDRCGGMDSFGTETLVEALKTRKDVEYISSSLGYKDYGLYIESGSVIHGTGKVTILAVEGIY
jgi:hypothetical protein